MVPRLTFFLCLLAFSLFGQSEKQSATLLSITDLPARKPRSGERVEVLTMSNGTNFPSPRVFRHVASSSDTADGFHVFTNAGASGRYISIERFAGTQRGEWFGIVADGTTDNTSALQSAINYCLANSCPDLLLPSGTILTGSISITNGSLEGGLTIRGPRGVRSTIKAKSGTGTLISVSACRLLEFSDLAIHGNSIATNLLNIDASTQIKIDKNLFYYSAGNFITFTGAQNYGHRISGNKFVSFPGIGVSATGTSVTKMQIDNNTFDSLTYTNSAIGLQLGAGAVSVTSFDNVYQRLSYGIDNRGSVAGSNIANTSLLDYYEACWNAPIRLCADGQISGFDIVHGFFNVLLTTNQYTVVDAGSAQQLYGFSYSGFVTPDAGKAVNIPNLAGTGWRIDSAATDYSTDFAFSTNYPSLFAYGVQSAKSCLVTNFSSVSAGTTNLNIVMFRMPDYLVVNPTDAASAVTIAGTMPHGARLKMKNLSTNQLYFYGFTVGQNLDEEFQYTDGSWKRMVGPYLLNTGGTVSGAVTLSSTLAVGGASTFTGNATFNGTAANPWSYWSYGSYGSTNIGVLSSKSGALLTLAVNGDPYAIIGTNNTFRIEKAVVASGDVTANTFTLGGTTISAWPSGGGGPTNGSAIYINGSGSKSVVNFIDTSEIAHSYSGTNDSISIVANSIGTNKVSSAFRSFFLDRANHTGTQAISTVTSLQTELDNRQRTNSVLTELQGLTSGSAGQIVTATGPGTFAMSNAPSGGTSWTLTVNGSGSVTNIEDSADITNTVTGSTVYHGLKPTGVTAGTYGVVGGVINAAGQMTTATNMPTPKFVLNIGFPTTTTLASNTTYFVPRTSSHTWSQSVSYTNGSVCVPFKSRLVSVVSRIRIATSASPTGSNVVFYARKNDSTDVAVWTNAVFDTGYSVTNILTDYTSSNLQFNANDYIALKYATPAWWSTVPQPAGGFDLCFELIP